MDLLRKLAVDRFASMTEENVYLDVVDDLPAALVLGIAKKMKAYYCALGKYDQRKVPEFEEGYKLDFE